MQRNPRQYLVQDAKMDFLKFWVDFLDKHDDLTMAELISILSSELQSLVNISVQQEWKEARREQSESRGQENGR